MCYLITNHLIYVLIGRWVNGIKNKNICSVSLNIGFININTYDWD